MRSSLLILLTSVVHSYAIAAQYDHSFVHHGQDVDYAPDISGSLQNILSNTHGSPAYTYPTDLTRGIVPKPVHSHNDYWRDIPFFTALSFGCVSVEADVWLYNDTLYVGHEELALTAARTFDALYVQPILYVLNRQNPQGEIVQSTRKNGVFDTASEQTLYLFVDVKTDGATTWPTVIQALEPLRQAGYLTTVNGTVVTKGAVTVIGTGGTPLDQIEGVSPRDYFFDADIALLDSSQSKITSSISPIASADFESDIGPVNGISLNETQLIILRARVATAKSKGIVLRYWNTPTFPISTRNAVWRTLSTEASSLISADDIRAATGFGSAPPW